MNASDQHIIRRISQIIASSDDHEDGLCLALGCLAEYMQVDACTALVMDDVSGQLVVEGTHGLGRNTVHKVRFSPALGVTGLAFRTDETVNVSDKDNHPHFHAFPGSRSRTYHALLAVPLRVAGRTIGVLDLARKKVGQFDEQIVAIAESVAPSLAMFIFNARLAAKAESEGVSHTEEVQPRLKILKGRAITDGSGVGTTLVLRGSELLDGMTPEYTEDLKSELELMEKSVAHALRETEHVRDEARHVLAEADTAIFDAHLMFLQDPTLHQQLVAAVRSGLCLRSALGSVMALFEAEWAKLEGSFLAERIADLKDVLLRVYLAADLLEGVEESHKLVDFEQISGDVRFIIVASELLPSQLLQVPIEHLAGILCEKGGETSHAAILARALNLPMLSGIENVTQIMRTGEMVGMDCSSGTVHLHPSAQLVRKLAKASSSASSDGLETVWNTLPSTADGTQVRLAGNVSLLNELPCLSRHGAQGVGLYRTEFLFMLRSACPPEDEQYNVYRQVVEACNGEPTTIRLLDVGGDKPLPYIDFGHEENPFLGWRGIRFLLANPKCFKPHLRAILRATAHGPVNILLPMVADLEELLLVKDLLAEAEAELKLEGLAVDSGHCVGIMLEVPSAIWQLDVMLPHIDFVSIGTNDLTQYTLVVDRSNTRVTQWFRQTHPVVLRLIHETCRIAAKFPDKEVSICGELAGMALCVPFLVGAGLRNLSMSPQRIPDIHEILAKVSLSACEEHAKHVLECTLHDEVLALMNTFARKHDLLP
ncbi:MAG: phosphoenolpyruvate--protein phosphotransferase [Lentisphaeria bacterium]|nr:phosphoenolpyruvate--protein phosphotransferase [Lentisphaeria bacterium]